MISESDLLHDLLKISEPYDRKMTADKAGRVENLFARYLKDLIANRRQIRWFRIKRDVQDKRVAYLVVVKIDNRAERKLKVNVGLKA